MTVRNSLNYYSNPWGADNVSAYYTSRAYQAQQCGTCIAVPGGQKFKGCDPPVEAIAPTCALARAAYCQEHGRGGGGGCYNDPPYTNPQGNIPGVAQDPLSFGLGDVANLDVGGFFGDIGQQISDALTNIFGPFADCFTKPCAQLGNFPVPCCVIGALGIGAVVIIALVKK